MGEVSGILASLNAFAYDVIKFLSVQDLVVASKIKMGKKKMEMKKRNFNKYKESLIKGLPSNCFHHAWQHFRC